MKKRILRALLAAVAVLLFATGFATAGETKEYADFVVLSTTDMHGKCWNVNLLTGSETSENMLRVSTAVRQIREEYGKENVLLIDNGDLFQGNKVSEIQLLRKAAGTSGDVPAMALCLKEMEYDAFVLGNHEFNFKWSMMRDIYRWLEENGISVLAANVCYDGSDPAHPAGEEAFTPYIIRTISVNGREHKIGILGLENTDITRWDLAENYPGLRFTHPGNDEFSIAREAELFLPRMREEGCEFIVCAYHSSLGKAEGELVFGENTADQGDRLLKETEDIDFLILGHDHISTYSSLLRTNRAGREICVVNGGARDLTKTVFRFSEDENGALRWEMLSSENLKPAAFATDQALEEIIRPYAEMAEAEVEVPVGKAAGNWDGDEEYALRQTSAADLVLAAVLERSTADMQDKLGEAGLAHMQTKTGLDHADVDLAVTTTSSIGHTFPAGDLSMKDLCRLYPYTSEILVLPVYGRDIRAILEEDAARGLFTRVINGKAYFFQANTGSYTRLLFGGLSFIYDLSKPEGERVQIGSFSNGRSFVDDGLYLVAVSNFILENERCGFRKFSSDDAVWSQLDDGAGETLQDMLGEYIRQRSAENGAVRPEDIPWHWELTYSTEAVEPVPEGVETVASLVARPENSHTYILFNEAKTSAPILRELNDGYETAEIAAYGNDLAGDLPEGLIFLTAHVNESQQYLFTDGHGRTLTLLPGPVLRLTEEAEGARSLWRLEETDGGWFILNAEEEDLALEDYNSRFGAHQLKEAYGHLFNFYEVK